MRQTITFLLLCFLATNTIWGQATISCTPNAIYKDSLFGVYPKPYDAVLNPTGGITKVACVGKPYVYTLTAKIPDTLSYSGIPIPIYSIKIKSVKGLPTGLSYGCNKANCDYKPKDLGCVNLYGTVADTVKPRDFPLAISLSAATLLGTIDLDYPGPLLPIPGTYTLKVVAKNSPLCTVAAEDLSQEIVYLSHAPNPASDKVTFFISSEQKADYTLKIVDMTGKVLHRELLSLHSDLNTVEYDASPLSNGLYFYSISNEKGTMTRKLVVQK